jgi:hypothetical protein
VKTEHEQRTLKLYYRNGEIGIDVNPGKKRDVVHIPFDKEWHKGKVYTFALKGRVALEKVELKVMGLAN